MSSKDTKQDSLKLRDGYTVCFLMIQYVKMSLIPKEPKHSMSCRKILLDFWESILKFTLISKHRQGASPTHSPYPSKKGKE